MTIHKNALITTRSQGAGCRDVDLDRRTTATYTASSCCHLKLIRCNQGSDGLADAAPIRAKIYTARKLDITGE